jgi:D-alanyl-D-alanine carboxypeptidase/D-alanyl-D-alanine-endopeptidase (penicillin-binding protein 4)
MYDAMKKLLLSLTLLLFIIAGNAQGAFEKIEKAYNIFENDSQMKSSISSLYVIDARSGEVVFEKNAGIGLPTASTLKIITAASAYEILGRDFLYQTLVSYSGSIEKNILKGDLVLKGSGDPTFGSWRYNETKRQKILSVMVDVLKKKGISRIDGSLVIDESGFSSQPLPGGWIWDDVGNYYGAGSWAINWNENQYDLILKPGKKPGDPTTIVRMDPDPGYKLLNGIKTGAKGSGDNGYIYLAPYQTNGYTEGTIPLQDGNFTISGSMSHPAPVLGKEIRDALARNGITISKGLKVLSAESASVQTNMHPLYTFHSPSMDSIIYWFLQKSINLYGESLARTIAFQKKGKGSIEDGVDIIRDYWKDKGITPSELHMVDGSGLSPLNRVTTHAQVMALKFAREQPWFTGYYAALPVYNGMKMKSGTISGTKGFCGYQKSKDGHEYIFSFLVNNFQGSSSAVVDKMYKVLDQLK